MDIPRRTEAPVREKRFPAQAPDAEALAKEARVRETRRRQKEQYKRLMKTLAKKRRSDLAEAEATEAERAAFKEKVRKAGLRRARQQNEQRRREAAGDSDAAPPPAPARGSAARTVQSLRDGRDRILKKQELVTDEDFLRAEEEKEALKRKRKETTKAPRPRGNQTSRSGS